MTGEKIPAHVLAVRAIPNVSEALAQAWQLPHGWRSVGILAADCDDVTYCGLDEATKAAVVEVVYAKSLYAGAANASTAFAGEVIGILAGPTPSEVLSGLQAAVAFIGQNGFTKANADGSVCYFAHTVSSTGSYLSGGAGIPLGQALAYLIAPPLEAMVGLDAAMKAADVELSVLYAPPSETNFGGGLLTGSQSACKAACDAFAAAVAEIAARPREV